MTAAQTRAALAADRIDFIDEDDRRGVLLGFRKQIAHAARAHADEHFNEIRTGDREERHAGFARYGARQQRFARSGRAYQQNAGGNLRADLGKAAGILQELYDFAQFFLFLVRARNVLKRNLVGLGIHLARAALAEAHHAALAAAALLAHQEHPQQYEQHHRNDQRQPFRQPRRLRRQFRSEGEGIFGGAHGVTQHAFIDVVYIIVELVRVGDDRLEIIALREVRIRNAAVFAQAVQHIFLNDDAFNGFARVFLRKRFAVIRAQIGFHPIQQLGIAQILIRGGTIGIQHPYHGQNRRQQHKIQQRSMQKPALFIVIQSEILSFR